MADPADPDFSLTVAESTDHVLLAVSGELDVATAPVLQTAFDELALRRLPITVDLSEVLFMDSTGLAALLAMRRHATSGASLVLRRPSDAVQRIFELTGIAGVFAIEGES